MTPDERRSMRREQVGRFLSTDMTAKEWCSLNGVPESTLYAWMARFRESEPELFGKPSTSEWIELTRESISARTALATRGGAVAIPETGQDPGHGRESCDFMRSADGAPAVIVRLNGADVVVPGGAAESHVAAVLRAVASL